MRARDPEESRSQTHLELLFDLAFSAASGFAAVRLTEILRAGAVTEAVAGLALVFFAIWWAWLNFAWFSSAYDTDDGVSWLVTTVLILGAATLAAGVPAAVGERDLTVITVGYAVMRLPLAAQWLRAAVGDPMRRRICLRFALGMSALQLAWIGRLALPGSLLLAAFLLLAVLELTVPWWAQLNRRIPTNPVHLAGRYGRFTLTVAAQVIAAAVYSVRLGLAGPARFPQIAVAVIVVFGVVALLWLYYALPHARVAAGPFAKLWEYGHYLIVGAVGALGGGARYLAESVAEPQARWAALPLVSAIAATLLVLWLVCVVPGRSRWGLLYPTCVVLIMLSAVLIPSALWAAAVAVLLLFVLVGAEGVRAAPASRFRPAR